MLKAIFAAVKKSNEEHVEELVRLQKTHGTAAPQASRRDIIARSAEAQTSVASETLWKRNRSDTRGRMEEIAKRTGYSVPVIVPEAAAHHGLAASSNFKTWLGPGVVVDH